MKRFFSLLLVLCLLGSLWGCSFSGNSKDQAVFYYCQKDYAFGAENGVITAEERDVTGHAGDISYLLSLYLMGPLDEELSFPFSGRTRLLGIEMVENTLCVELTDLGKSLTDSQFTLGCACLTMTCLELTDASQVTITSGERTVTMDESCLTLYDSITPGETTTTEETK